MDDLIYRQAAIAELNEITKMKHAILDSLDISDRRARDMIEAELGQINDDIDSIKDMPSAQPRNGKWICWYEEIEDDTCTEYIPHCKCSECGTEYNPHTVKFINFCPNCGAEMEVNHDQQSYTGIY